MGASKQIEQGRQKEDEPIEVSYTILRSVNQRNRSDIIQKVVAAINVQLTLENNQSIPMISLMILILLDIKISSLFLDRVAAGNLDVFMNFSKIS